MSENPNFLAFRRRLSIENDMAEYEDVYRSPPDGLMTQICKILANKVNFTGPTTSKKEMRRIRKREKLRMSVVLPWKSEHFEKIIGCSPTPSRPLQGLWKGIGVDRSLNLYLVSYDEEWDDISCEMVGSSFTPNSYYRARVFSASITAVLESPFSSEEKHTYNSRLHLCSPAQSDRADSTSSDVLRIFYADSGLHLDAPDLSETLRMPTGESGYMQMGLLDLGFFDMITFLI